ncbi:pilus assembly protein [Kangiella aquimarina]|uniref:PilC/PilY family type IV pilus protein n=1 Tax=Kangiella aquimarina TaxID=261965 RepID=A0ABZ0X2D7_9GAMM|nr:PilC/PilY family type IV pilus protein [Kangiella aquimarina]WQG84741.1 PilC/PilY family type IV pilus protein [Kangiella aquimarina]
MFKKILYSTLVASYIALPLLTSTTKADDTEVYFNDAGLLEISKPKVLILLEWSANTNGSERLANLRSAFKSIAQDQDFVDNVDIGVQIFYSSGNAASAKTTRPVMGLNDVDSDGHTFAGWAENELQTSSLTGGPALTKGMVEAARYFQGMEIVYGATFQKPNEKGFEMDPLVQTDNLKSGIYDNLSADFNCGGNAIIVISGGQPGNNKDNSEQITEVTNGTCGDNCDAPAAVAKYLKSQKVDTYAVFSGSQAGLYANLKAITDASETEDPFRWDGLSDTSLADYIKDKLEKVLRQGSSFVQAGVTVSQQNRLELDNSLYFSQFQPDNRQRWPGNIKKYKIVDSVLMDSTPIEAVNEKDLFKNGDPIDDNGEIAKSYWSPYPDGNNVRLGGAAEALTSHLILKDDVTLFDGSVIKPFGAYTRKVLTNLGLSRDQALKDITEYSAADLGIDSSRLQEYYDQARGLFLSIIEDWDTTDPENPVLLGTYDVATLGGMGDPLHSVPKIVKYAIPSGEEEIVREIAFFGTNMGYLHAIDIATGEEVWSYIPDEFVKDLDKFYEDVVIDKPEDHKYGLDGQVLLVHADADRDARVDGNSPDEKAYLVVGMRRGGKSYHVLDISDLNTPKYLYKIDNNSARAEKMGQTWSEPKFGNIKYNGQQKTVLMFGGGYDSVRDDTVKYEFVDMYDPFGNPIKDLLTGEIKQEKKIAGIAYSEKPTLTQGNNIFLIDIRDGTVLWDAKTDAGLEMTDSVVGDLTPFGFNSEGLIDHIYASDTGGRIYRVDIDNESAVENTDQIFAKGYVIADLNDDATVAGNRRFYYGPTAATIERPGGQSFVAIAIGSGYRAHPLDETVDDFFYMIKDRTVFDSSAPTKLTHGNLKDITSYVSQEQAALSGVDFDAIDGWKLELTEVGEKVLAEARIINNKIVFTSYVPVATKIDRCTVVTGAGKLYGVNVIDGTSFFSNDTRSISDIYPGLPPAYQLLYLGDDGFVGLVGNNVINDDDSGIGGTFQDLLTSGLGEVERMNWQKVEP